jgi:hypothetical protein
MTTGKKHAKPYNYRGGDEPSYDYWKEEGRELTEALRTSKRPGVFKHQAILDYWETIRNHSTDGATGHLVRPINGEGEEA